MKKIDLTNIELFKNNISFDFEGKLIDLQKNYYCAEINEVEYNMVLIFKNNFDDNDILKLVFEYWDVVRFKYDFSDLSISKKVKNFYRGRYLEGVEFLEKNEFDQFYYFLDFLEGQKIEVFAERVFLYDE